MAVSRGLWLRARRSVWRKRTQEGQEKLPGHLSQLIKSPTVGESWSMRSISWQKLIEARQFLLSLLLSIDFKISYYLLIFRWQNLVREDFLPDDLNIFLLAELESRYFRDEIGEIFHLSTQLSKMTRTFFCLLTQIFVPPPTHARVDSKKHLNPTGWFWIFHLIVMPLLL